MGKGTETRFFVSINGNDNWSGRLSAPNVRASDGPFAALARARNAVREMKEKRSLKEPLCVMVRGGKYYLKEPLELTAEDSGTQGSPITYSAYPGEKPVLSGGIKLTNWKPYKGKILQCAIPAKARNVKFRQLFFNGQRQIRARYPRFDQKNPLYGGWAFMEGPAEEGSAPAFRYKPGTLPNYWSKPAEAEVNVFVTRFGINNIIPIRAIDHNKGVISLEHYPTHWDRPPFLAIPDGRPFLTNNRFIVENLLEELEQPGEWCSDSDAGTIYFWPPAQLTEESEVVIPFLDCLVDIQGASYITVSGFTFVETGDGDNYQRPGLEGYGVMFPMEGWKYCGEAVHLKDAEHITIEGNLFKAVGGNAVYLECHASRNVIRKNEISFAGANGICLVGTRAEHPAFNQVADNHIHHCGVINKYIAGVFLGVSDGNVISHNSIHHISHHGINLASNGFGRNIVEYNEIRHTCQETFDNGGINSWMDAVDSTGQIQRDAERAGHIIRYNLVADTYGAVWDEKGNFFMSPDKGASHGIYLDDCTSNCVVYGNVVVRSGFGIMVHNGKNNVIENNIIVDCRFGLFFNNWSPAVLRKCAANVADFMTGNRACRNIVYSSDPEAIAYLFSEWLDTGISQSDDNLFFNASGSELKMEVWSGRERKLLSLVQWQQMGYDTHSMTADPLFANPKRDDYRLKPKSPAFRLGFETLPKTVGLEKKELTCQYREGSHGANAK